MKRSVLVLAAIAAVTFTTPAFAQRPAIVFDQKKFVVVNGTVKDLDWMNPRSVLTVMVKDPKIGKETPWSFELSAPQRAVKSGWMHNSLQPGDKVTLTMHPAKNGTHTGQLVRATLPDGTMVGGDEPVLGGVKSQPKGGA
jgi:hypothetical protein